MLNYVVEKRSKSELVSEPKDGKFGIGGFVYRDIAASGVEFNSINCLAISDWDINCVVEFDGALVDLTDDNGLVVHVILLNLNEADAASDENTTIMTELIKGKGFTDITDFVGYETRMCFISEKNEVSRQVISEFKKESGEKLDIDFGHVNNTARVSKMNSF